VKPSDASGVLAFLTERGVPASQIGTVNCGNSLDISTAGKSFSWPLAELGETWGSTISRLMED